MKATETARLCALQAKKISDHVAELYSIHVYFENSFSGSREVYDLEAEAGTGKALYAVMDDITSLRRDLLALRKKLEGLR